jgi:hypothetical protein
MDAAREPVRPVPGSNGKRFSPLRQRPNQAKIAG